MAEKNPFLTGTTTATTPSEGNPFLAGTPSAPKKSGGGFHPLKALKHAAGSGIQMVGSALGAVQQATFRTGSGISEAIEGRPVNALKELGRGAKELLTIGQGVEDIDFAHAVTPIPDREKGNIRKLPKYVNSAATVLLDPLLPLNPAKGAAAAKGLTAAEKLGGKALVEEVGKVGAKKALEAVPGSRNLLLKDIEKEALAAGAKPRRTLTEIAKGEAKGGAQEGAERVARRTVGALEDSTRAVPRAIKAGKEAVGEGIGKGVAKIPGAVSAGKALAPIGNEIKDLMGGLFKPRYGVEGKIGKKASDVMEGFGGAKAAAVSTKTKEALIKTQAVINQIGAKVTRGDLDALGALAHGTPLPSGVNVSNLQELAAHLDDLEKETLANYTRGTNLGPQIAKGGKAVDTIEALSGIPKAQGGDFMQSVLERHLASIQNVEEAGYVNKLKTVTDHTGAPVFKPVGKGGVSKGMEVVHFGPHGSFEVVPEVAREVKRVARILSDDPSIRKISKAFESYDRFWKSSATVLPVSAQFPLRNARSNVYLNWLDGLKNPEYYVKARNFQKKVNDVVKKYEKEIATGDVDTVFKTHLSPEDYKLLRDMQARDVVGTSYSANEFGLGGRVKPEKFKNVERTGSAGKRAVGALGNENKAFKAGRKVNSAIEDNARIANYMHNIDRYGSADIAAEHVKRFLFDYSDLTAAERKIKRVVPFYTFMRKNTPLQLQSLIEQPGRVGSRIRASEAMTDTLPEDSPEYMQRQGFRMTPGGVASVLGKAGKNLAFNPDTPLAASISTVTPAAQILGAITSKVPGLEKITPIELKGQSAGEILRPIIGMTGGGIAGPIKAAAEEAAGVSLFSGQRFSPGEIEERGMKAMFPGLARLGGTVAPLQHLIKQLEILPITQAQKDETIKQWLLRQAGVTTREVK